jgi:UDP-glucuronate 4-epimerase
MKYRILITGVAGFIGFHIARKIMNKNHKIIGIDNLNKYYDVKLKKDRLKELKKFSKKKKFYFQFKKIDLCKNDNIKNIFNDNKIDIIIHLAAQAGVRYSIEHPEKYVSSNLVGFCNLIEIAKNYKVRHFLYASSSSVYGINKKTPFSEKHSVDHPIQLYAATKRSNELIAHAYSSLFNLPTTGMRFFTVYGPWGRPDMALFKFTKKIINNEKIDVFNYGNHKRDFTFVDDVADAVKKICFKMPFNQIKNLSNPSISPFPYRIINIGNGKSEKLMSYIKYIEQYLGKKAKINFLSKQPGDIEKTISSTLNLRKLINLKKKTKIKIGIKKFIDWYKFYYKVK